MKKILAFILLFTILLSSALLPVMAATLADVVPQINTVWTDTAKYPYAVIIKSGDEYRLYLLNSKPYMTSSTTYVSDDRIDFPYIEYKCYPGASRWDFVANGQNGLSLKISQTVFTSVDLVYNGYTYMNFEEDVFNIPGSVTDNTPWYQNIWNSIVDLPHKTAKAFEWLEDTITNGFNQIDNAIKGLVEGVLNGIKDIFIPDAEGIKNELDNFTDGLRDRFNIDTSAFEGLFQGESPVTDIYADYNIAGVGDFHLKLFDVSFLVQGIEHFRPIIRGFIVLMLFLFHIRQIVGFFGYDAGVVAGRTEHIKASKENQGG